MVIDQAIRAGTWPNATVLSQQLEVDSRTVRRDLTYMRDQLKAPLKYDARHNGYHYTELTYRLAYFQVTEGELMALMLAQRLLRQYRDTPYGSDLQRIFAKLHDLLPERISISLDTAADCLAVLPPVTTVYNPALFATLAGAVVEHRRVEVVYHTADRDATTTRTLDPYHMMLRGDDWYIVARDSHRNEIRVFAVQRVRSASVLDERFDRPIDFRIEDYMGDSFRVVRGEGHYKVALHFVSPTALRIAEKTWHPSQSIEPSAEGGLILRFEVSDLREVKRWVLFWGTDCRVLEPAELIETVRTELQTLREHYEKPTNSRRARPRR